MSASRAGEGRLRIRASSAGPGKPLTASATNESKSLRGQPHAALEDPVRPRPRQRDEPGELENACRVLATPLARPLSVEAAHPLEQPGILDPDETSTERSRGLDRAEAEERDVGERAPRVAGPTKALRTVFDQQQAVPPAHVCERLEIGTGAEEMSDEERAGARTDQPFEEVGARGQRVGIDVDRQRAQAVSFEHVNHVRVRDRRDRDLVAGLEGERFEREIERGTHREAGEAASTARPRIEHALLGTGSTRQEACAEREEEVGERDVRQEPRTEPPRRGVPRPQELGLERRDRSPHSLGGFAGGEPRMGREILERHGLTESDAPAAKGGEPLGPDDRGGNERHAGREGDSGWTGMGSCPVLLAQPLRAASSLREDPDGVAATRELDRGLDRAEVALAPAHREQTEPACDPAEQGNEELGLRHPADLPRVEGVRKRKAVEIRELARREDEASARRHAFEAVNLRAEEHTKDGPRERRQDSIRRRPLSRGNVVDRVGRLQSQAGVFQEAARLAPAACSFFAFRTSSAFGPCPSGPGTSSTAGRPWSLG